jgi:hypothetical protein
VTSALTWAMRDKQSTIRDNRGVLKTWKQSRNVLHGSFAALQLLALSVCMRRGRYREAILYSKLCRFTTYRDRPEIFAV